MKKVYWDLIEKAKKVRLNAYTPYSKFCVGAALLAHDGKVFTGCNIENASFGLTICAERVAMFKALSIGVKRFEAMVVLGDTKGPCRPCGARRQVLMEFFPNMKVIMTNFNNDIEIIEACDLLPYAFRGHDFQG